MRDGDETHGSGVYVDPELFHAANTMKSRSTALAFIVSLVAVALPASDLDRLAQDLERVLGKGRVEVRAEEEPRRVSSRSVTEVVEAMNRERAARGLEPLRFSESLSLAAH